MDNNYCSNKKMSYMAMICGFTAGVIATMLVSRKMRHNTVDWAKEMRDEVMRRIQETKDMTQEKYDQIIKEVRPRFEKIKDVSSREIDELIDELKLHWQNISVETKKQITNATEEQKQKRESGLDK